MTVALQERTLLPGSATYANLTPTTTPVSATVHNSDRTPMTAQFVAWTGVMGAANKRLSATEQNSARYPAEMQDSPDPQTTPHSLDCMGRRAGRHALGKNHPELPLTVEAALSLQPGNMTSSRFCETSDSEGGHVVNFGDHGTALHVRDSTPFAFAMIVLHFFQKHAAWALALSIRWSFFFLASSLLRSNSSSDRPTSFCAGMARASRKAPSFRARRAQL